MVPRFSFEARSFSHDSTTMAAPAKQKPEIARMRIQAIGVRMRRLRRITTAASEATTANTRTWPTRRTIAGMVRQPQTKPTDQPVPIRPSSKVEKP